jgi:hypothetical protein
MKDKCGAKDSALDGQILSRQAVGPWSDLALHTIGWRAFQDLCSQVCEVVLNRPVEVFREAQDGGQDAVFLLSAQNGKEFAIGTVQCKHTSDARKALAFGDLSPEVEHVEQLVAAGQADTYVLMTNMSVDAPVAKKIREEFAAPRRSEGPRSWETVPRSCDPRQRQAEGSGAPRFMALATLPHFLTRASLRRAARCSSTGSRNSRRMFRRPRTVAPCAR